jgi:hypothetical protein
VKIKNEKKPRSGYASVDRDWPFMTAGSIGKDDDLQQHDLESAVVRQIALHWPV